MRHALILAGGAGVRLWPMSRQANPKQLIPFLGGKSLLELAWERLSGLIPPSRCYVCAGLRHRQPVLAALPELPPDNFLGEPAGRDTVNAIGFSAAVIGGKDPEASLAVFTADHLIRPVDRFQQIVRRGYEVVEKSPRTLVTFGIEPSFPSTGYGYLELGAELGGGTRTVKRFKEKPEAEDARMYFESGPGHYLWNSGMFVWRTSTLLDCLRRYDPANFAGITKISEAWNTSSRDAVLEEVYPTLKKISVDYAIMEPASLDASVQVAALPMPLEWLDIGSWPTFASTCPTDASGNALGTGRAVLEESSGTLVASSDPRHLIAASGCDDLIIVHTPDATLVCRADRAESIKALQQRIAGLYGPEYL